MAAPQESTQLEGRNSYLAELVTSNHAGEAQKDIAETIEVMIAQAAQEGVVGRNKLARNLALLTRSLVERISTNTREADSLGETPQEIFDSLTLIGNKAGVVADSLDVIEEALQEFNLDGEAPVTSKDVRRRTNRAGLLLSELIKEFKSTVSSSRRTKGKLVAQNPELIYQYLGIEKPRQAYTAYQEPSALAFQFQHILEVLSRIQSQKMRLVALVSVLFGITAAFAFPEGEASASDQLVASISASIGEVAQEDVNARTAETALEAAINELVALAEEIGNIQERRAQMLDVEDSLLAQPVIMVSIYELDHPEDLLPAGTQFFIYGANGIESYPRIAIAAQGTDLRDWLTNVVLDVDFLEEYFSGSDLQINANGTITDPETGDTYLPVTAGLSHTQDITVALAKIIDVADNAAEETETTQRDINDLEKNDHVWVTQDTFVYRRADNSSDTVAYVRNGTELTFVRFSEDNTFMKVDFVDDGEEASGWIETEQVEIRADETTTSENDSTTSTGNRETETNSETLPAVMSFPELALTRAETAELEVYLENAGVDEIAVEYAVETDQNGQFVFFAQNGDELESPATPGSALDQELQELATILETITQPQKLIITLRRAEDGSIKAAAFLSVTRAFTTAGVRFTPGSLIGVNGSETPHYLTAENGKIIIALNLSNPARREYLANIPSVKATVDLPEAGLTFVELSVLENGEVAISAFITETARIDVPTQQVVVKDDVSDVRTTDGVVLASDISFATPVPEGIARARHTRTRLFLRNGEVVVTEVDNRDIEVVDVAGLNPEELVPEPQPEAAPEPDVNTGGGESEGSFASEVAVPNSIEGQQPIFEFGKNDAGESIFTVVGNEEINIPIDGQITLRDNQGNEVPLRFGSLGKILEPGGLLDQFEFPPEFIERWSDDYRLGNPDSGELINPYALHGVLLTDGNVMQIAIPYVDQEGNWQLQILPFFEQTYLYVDTVDGNGNVEADNTPYIRDLTSTSSNGMNINGIPVENGTPIVVYAEWRREQSPISKIYVNNPDPDVLILDRTSVGAIEIHGFLIPNN